MKKSYALTLMASAIALMTLVTNVQADPITRGGSGSFVTGAGTEGTYERSRTRDGGTATREQSVNVGGQSYTRSADTTLDKGTGTVQRTVTVPAGRTSTASGSVAPDAEGGGVHIEATGRRGRTGSATVTPD